MDTRLWILHFKGSYLTHLCKNLLIKNGDSTESFITNSSTIAPVAGVPSINLSLGSIEGLYYGMEVVALKNEEYMLYSSASLY